MGMSTATAAVFDIHMDMKPAVATRAAKSVAGLRPARATIDTAAR